MTGRDWQLDCNLTWTLSADPATELSVVGFPSDDDLLEKFWYETIIFPSISTTAPGTGDHAAIYGVSEGELTDLVESMVYGVDSIVHIPLPDSEDDDDDDMPSNSMPGPISVPVISDPETSDEDTSASVDLIYLPSLVDLDPLTIPLPDDDDENLVETETPRNICDTEILLATGKHDILSFTITAIDSICLATDVSLPPIDDEERLALSLDCDVVVAMDVPLPDSDKEEECSVMEFISSISCPQLGVPQVVEMQRTASLRQLSDPSEISMISETSTLVDAEGAKSRSSILKRVFDTAKSVSSKIKKARGEENEDVDEAPGKGDELYASAGASIYGELHYSGTQRLC